MKLELVGSCLYNQLPFGSIFRIKGHGNHLHVKTNRMDFGDAIDLLGRGKSSINPNIEVEYFVIEPYVNETTN